MEKKLQKLSKYPLFLSGLGEQLFIRQLKNISHATTKLGVIQN
jgi:hypothetical protein